MIGNICNGDADDKKRKNKMIDKIRHVKKNIIMEKLRF